MDCPKLPAAGCVGRLFLAGQQTEKARDHDPLDAAPRGNCELRCGHFILPVHADRLDDEPTHELGLPTHTTGLQARHHTRPIRPHCRLEFPAHVY